MKLVQGKNKENINALKFYEYFENENEFFLVMELCDDNLFQLLTKKKEVLIKMKYMIFEIN